MGRLEPIHEPLPLLAERTLRLPAAPVELVTFLNKTLKRRGLIFGLRQAAEGQYTISIYDVALIRTGEGSSPEAATAGQVDRPSMSARIDGADRTAGTSCDEGSLKAP